MSTSGTTDSSQTPTQAVRSFTDLQVELLDFFDNRPGGGAVAAPQNLIVTHVTNEYLTNLDLSAPPAPRQLEQELLASCYGIIANENLKIPKNDGTYPIPRHLSTWQVARILLRLHHVVRIAPTGANTDREYDMLAMYIGHGPSRGIYTASEDDLRTTARLYNTQLTTADFKEVVAVLREDAPRVHLNSHRDLIAANNGIVNYGTEPLDITLGGKRFHFEPKKVHPFDPAIVFTVKSAIDYVENAPMVRIPHPDPADGDWEVGEWIHDLFYTEGDEEFNQRNAGLAALTWEVLGALVRPHVSWNKTAWFHSEQGNNGKGTLCSLGRNLLGSGAHTSIPIRDFGKEFALEPLIKSSAIIVDENPVGIFVEEAGNYKTVITNDTLQINRKHRVPIAFEFHGFMIQCVNDLPKFKDKSESLYRRQLILPFTKSFTGAEKRYIKDDFLKRREVLEHVLWYVINCAGAVSPGSYYELSEPPATQALLAEYKDTNDPVRAFWTEFRELFVWDLLPFFFLYDLYRVWFTRVSPSGRLVGRQQFITDLFGIVQNDPLWHCNDKAHTIRPGSKMAVSEPLIAEYELKDWYTPGYTGTDPNRLGIPLLKPNYRGLLRTVPLGTAAPAAPVSSDD
ncbi:DNA primase family protein [Arthrobacter bambusae]|uniref:DNA primase/helicase n=1 Tax=Arthrobacter bambusae TaxID=1338426 RepID=A0AAW8DDM6_9MICC|nr:phage/plasmid primase, P4 family [Arthrobacter bambusae]MDP9904729.1 putative DNA primase/helicase [Arthrobacter bambusae]MDQ0129545.1 putative DNA primase/helicase [Arthrobacter bambusae]MDQ0180842.1 putative DNA primase/helicase [Arthrobacter bambusae]